MRPLQRNAQHAEVVMIKSYVKVDEFSIEPKGLISALLWRLGIFKIKVMLSRR